MAVRWELGDVKWRFLIKTLMTIKYATRFFYYNTWLHQEYLWNIVSLSLLIFLNLFVHLFLNMIRKIRPSFVKSYPVLCQCISPSAAFVLWLLGCDPGGITPASNGHVFPGCSWLFCNSTTQLHQGNNCNFLFPNEFHNVISVRPWLRMKLKFDVMVRQEIWLGALFWLGPKWGEALLTALNILCGWWWLQWQ